MEKHIFEYENDKIKVSWDKNVCMHAAKCVGGLPEVFDPKAKPWINVEKASPEAIVETIKKCPSGALKYELKGKSNVETKSEDGVSNVEVTVSPNGPLLVSGQICVRDGSGNILHEGEKLALCRCGASSKKPLCDGTHRKIGFQG